MASLTLRNSEKEPAAVYLYALRLLGFRDYTAAGLTKRLLEKGFAKEDAEAAVKKVVEQGYLNDEKYAKRFAEHAVSSGRYAGFRLRMEMRKRGFADSLIEDAVNKAEDERDESSDILSLVERKFGDFSYAAADDKQKRKVFSYLQRKGYPISSIISSLRT